MPRFIGLLLEMGGSFIEIVWEVTRRFKPPKEGDCFDNPRAVNVILLVSAVILILGGVFVLYLRSLMN